MKKKDLKQAIREKEIQLLNLEQHMEKSKICSEVYDNVLLEKAILKKELQDSEKISFIENIKNLVPHRKKLICDYFKK